MNPLLTEIASILDRSARRTQLGFFSIVRKDADTFHIRARCREDLDSSLMLRAPAHPSPPILAQTTPGASFARRTICRCS